MSIIVTCGDLYQAKLSLSTLRPINSQSTAILYLANWSGKSCLCNLILNSFDKYIYETEKILLFGATGQIGRNLIRKLSKITTKLQL